MRLIRDCLAQRDEAAEQVPLLETGGIEAFLQREVLPHAVDAWYEPDSVKIGYEVNFTRYFLQAATDAAPGGDPSGYLGSGARNRGVAERDHRGHEAVARAAEPCSRLSTTWPRTEFLFKAVLNKTSVVDARVMDSHG